MSFHAELREIETGFIIKTSWRGERHYETMDEALQTLATDYLLIIKSRA